MGMSGGALHALLSMGTNGRENYTYFTHSVGIK